MTKDRDFKRIVRARAARTGDTYQQSQRALEGEAPDDFAPDVAGAAVTDAERAEGATVAELALRLADGKPTVPGPPWTKEMSELSRAALAARDAASQPGAGEVERSLARALRQQFDAVAAAAAESATPWTAESYLEARIARRLGVLAAARHCRQLLDQNPRDVVAREALAVLESIEGRLIESDPPTATR